MVHEVSVASAARRARAWEAHVLRLLPTESKRSGTQANYTRKPPRAVRGRAVTWEHGLAPKEQRLLARVVPFCFAWSECHQRGAARVRVGSARAGPRPQREQAQWRTRALDAQPTSRSEGQGWHVGAQPWRRRNGGFSPVQCPSIALEANAARESPPFPRRKACAPTCQPCPSLRQEGCACSALARRCARSFWGRGPAHALPTRARAAPRRRNLLRALWKGTARARSRRSFNTSPCSHMPALALTSRHGLRV